MRFGLVCLVGLLSGCITSVEVENSGLKTTRSYVLFIPVRKTVVQTQPRPPEAGSSNRPVTASADESRN